MTMKFKVSCNDLFKRNAIVVEINERNLKKKKNSRRVLPANYWDFIARDGQQEGSCMKLNRKVLLPAQIDHLLSGVDPNFVEQFVSKSDLVALHSILVTPNCYCVTEIMDTPSNKN